MIKTVYRPFPLRSKRESLMIVDSIKKILGPEYDVQLSGESKTNGDCDIQ